MGLFSVSSLSLVGHEQPRRQPTMPPAPLDAPPPAPAPSWLSAYAGRVRATLDVCGPPSWASLLASDAEIAAAHAALRPGA